MTIRSRTPSLICLALFIVVCLSASAQPSGQQYVGRYDVFHSFSYFASPNINLYQRGYNTEFGVNVRRWVALGGDFSVVKGNTSLVPNELSPALTRQLSPLLSTLPAGYKLYVPFGSTTYTFSAGPQINIRKFKPVMFFVRPALGAMHQSVTTRPIDSVQRLVVGNVVPSGKKSDTVPFYGVGWGCDIRVHDNFAIRVGFDYVHTNLFESLLKEGQNTLRVSIGPTFRWGPNVAK